MLKAIGRREGGKKGEFSAPCARGPPLVEEKFIIVLREEGGTKFWLG